VAGRDGGLHQLRLAAILLVIGDDADRLDHAAFELTCHDRRRDEAAAGDRDHALPRAALEQPPGQRLAVAMQLVPGDREVVRRGHQKSRPPSGTAKSGRTSTMSPASSGRPSTRTSLRKEPICRDGKLTTAVTWR